MNNKFKQCIGKHGFAISALIICGTVLGFFALATVSIVMSGAVIAMLWSWFVTPLFGLPALSIPYAIGLSILTHYMTYEYSGSGVEDKAKYYLVMIMRPCFAIIIGFIVKSFI